MNLFEALRLKLEDEDREKMHPELRRVLDIPSIAQRTPEWYKARHDLITASSCCDAMGENPYDRTARQKLIENKSTTDPEIYSGNIYTIHGTRFEPVATMFYEMIFGVRAYETGLILHPSISFIGASPDGLCEDGRMIEIKCPLRRKIKKKGKLNGEICPHYYWIQVQVQLEVCDLERCDFWQCNLREFDSFEEWYDWKPVSPMLVAYQPELKEWNGPRKGIYLLMADGSIIYPQNHIILMTETEWTSWVVWSLENSNKSLERIVYWRLDDCFNQPVYRDKKWFQSEGHPKLEKFWEDVLSMRNAGGPKPLSFYDESP